MPEHRLNTARPVDLTIEVDSGDIRVTAHAEATDDFVSIVTVEGRRADEVQVTQSGDSITIIGPRSSGFRTKDSQVHLDVIVPRDGTLSVRTGSADLQTEGVLARARVRTGSGDVHLDVVTGAATVETGSGEIRLEHAQGDTRAKSGSGTVSVGATDGALDVSTGSGDVEIDTSRGSTVAKTGSGDLNLATASADVTFTTGSGDLTIGTAHRGRVTLKAASGDLSIGIPAGVPVWTDLTTVSGRVRSTLSPVGEPEAGQEHVELRATTVSGDIVLTER